MSGVFRHPFSVPTTPQAPGLGTFSITPTPPVEPPTPPVNPVDRSLANFFVSQYNGRVIGTGGKAVVRKRQKKFTAADMRRLFEAGFIVGREREKRKAALLREEEEREV